MLQCSKIMLHIQNPAYITGIPIQILYFKNESVMFYKYICTLLVKVHLPLHVEMMICNRTYSDQKIFCLTTYVQLKF